MQYKSANYRIRGVVPLLVHNGSLADPLNPIVKEMKKYTGKRDKTEADHAHLSKLEWYGGLYQEDGKLVIPGEMVEAMLIEGAKKKKKGPAAKAGLVCERSFPIIYEGPQDIDELWEDGGFRFTTGVKVQRNRVMRTRPIFKKWELDLEIFYLDALLNKSDIEEFLRTAGIMIGLGTWRPKFGRFEVA